MNFNFNEFDDGEGVLGDENILENIENVTRNPWPNAPNIYIRNVMDPYTYFSDEEFRRRYRFTKTTVKTHLVPLVQSLGHLNHKGLPVSADIQLIIGLRFFATGSPQTLIGDSFLLSQPTVSRVVRRVAECFAGRLHQFVKFPSSLVETKRGFCRLGARRNTPGLPCVVGAIDCTHIKIKKPRGIAHGEAYRNRKGYFSINLQVVVGPDMKIYDVVARWPGSTHDSRIYRNSRVCSKFTNGNIDGVLVGDGGYACSPTMLTPIRRPHEPAEMRYNGVQIRTRNIIERTFGVLKAKFPCLAIGLGYKLSTTANTILTCCVLHNIAVECGEEAVEYSEQLNTEEMPVAHMDATVEGIAVRNVLIDNLYRTN